MVRTRLENERGSAYEIEKGTKGEGNVRFQIRSFFILLAL